MNIHILVPNVVKSYIAQFPEVRNNAYKYFNYDNRVVEERVERFDDHRAYRGPEDLVDADYDALVNHAKTLINPILAQYSARVAAEDALHIAIRSFANGFFDGKINANRYGVLLHAMFPAPVMHEAKKKKQDTEVKPSTLKQLDIMPHEIPKRVRKQQRGIPHLIREKGKVLLKSK